MIWNPFQRRQKTEESPPARREAESQTQARALVKAYLKETGPGLVRRSYPIRPREYDAGKAILESPRELQVLVVLEAAPRLVECIKRLSRGGGFSSEDPAFQSTIALRPLLSDLLRRKLPFGEDTISALVRTAAEARSRCAWEFPLVGIVRSVQVFVEEHGLSDSLRSTLQQLRAVFRKHPRYSEMRKAVRRIEEILHADEQSAKQIDLTTDEPWTRALRAALDRFDEATRAAWERLLSHCATATSSKPSKRWLKAAEGLIEPVSPEHFAAAAQECLGEIGKPGTPQAQWAGGYRYQAHPTQIHDAHSDLLRGLIWCTSRIRDDRLIHAVAEAAEICFQKIPGYGPRSPKIGNACLQALANMSEMAAVARLTRLKTRVKHASSRKQVAAALDAAAGNVGVGPDEVEELAVPTFGLTGVGEYRRQVGEYAVRLTVLDTRKTELRWIRPDGKPQKSVPAALKEGFADAIASVKRVGKEIEKMLPAQRDRIEQLFLRERSWPWEDLRSRYLDHPLVGTIARRLIWRFQSGPNDADGIWHDGKIVDQEGKELAWLGDDARVELWHPLLRGPDGVLAWRTWLETHEVRQPFKQAHREVYILTDAERDTDTYSNRFAAHVLKQHQFSALCRQRGWRYTLQGSWDSHNTPCLDLPVWAMRAEFWVDPAGDPEGDTSEMGIFLYVSTDQVRFSRLDDDTPVPLADVPPLVFTEVMRDVDLFVSVASVGNDPTWSDGGPGGRYHDYWQGYSFGDLSATARTRKEVLGGLIPRLKIADRCSLSEKFLIVRGDLRTYKIHLGSGNVLMSPNDEYLCIVPARGAAAKGAGKLFLPFEGDSTLSIILSKALVLAADTQIKDPTIRRQIDGR